MDNCQCLRVVFAGTPEFAVPALQALLNSSHDVVGVYTQPDRPSGRGRKLQAGPVKTCALQHAIPVYQPDSLRHPEAVETLAGLAPDVIVVVAYGLLLPAAVLSLPRLGCVNIHGSVLPRWRGAAPIHRAVLAGDATTGITIMLMDEGLDTGAVLSRITLPIEASSTSATLHDQLASAGAQLLLDTLVPWCAGAITAQAQDDELANYAAKLEKHEAVIDWTQTAVAIDRQVRAFNPWPVAETTLNSDRLRIWHSHVVMPADAVSVSAGAHHAGAGRVVKCDRSGLWVQCGDGLLSIDELQMPGKRAMPVDQFVNANDINDRVLGGVESDDPNA